MDQQRRASEEELENYFAAGMGNNPELKYKPFRTTKRGLD
jgi:hypothetical protein